MTSTPFIDRFMRAEDDFLLSLCGAHGALVDYQASWSSLQNDFLQALNSDNLGDETITRAHIAASNVALIAECFSDIENKYQTLSVQFHDELDSILRGVDGIHLTPKGSTLPSPSHRKSTRSPVSERADNHLPSFISPAYHWLLDNIHNPYPPPAFKSSLAEAYGGSVNSINSWFANARRRMGWTSLCREKFRGCRSDMTDAAYRAIVKEDPHRPLPLPLSHAFVMIKVSAEGLYSSVFTRSALAGDLDSVVKDMTNAEGKLVAENCHPSETANNVTQSKETDRPRGSADARLLHSYPSPDRSFTSSPVPPLDESLTDESEDEEDVLPPVVAGHKRRSPIVEPSDCPFPELGSRPSKRLRSDMFSGDSVPEVCLPSPPMRAVTSEDTSDVVLSIPPVHAEISQPNSQNPNGLRKRRLSDIDTLTIRKRPRSVAAAPRPQAVSDLLPCSNVDCEYSIDEWFNNNFDALFTLPPPVDAVEPDSSTQWEVEFFKDYSIPPALQKHPSKSPSLDTLVTFDARNSSTNTLTELEQLLQCIEDGTFVAASEMPSLPVTTSTPGPLLIPHHLSSDLSQTFDWASLFNDTATYECTANPISPCPQPLPDIGLSILQLPQVATTVPCDLSSKQAKLRQLQLMQEAIQRVEGELQLEGVSL